MFVYLPQFVFCTNIGHEGALSSAKINHSSELNSGATKIKELMAKEYGERLRDRPMRPDLKSFIVRKQEIFEMKIGRERRKESPDWSMEELDKVLAKIKNNKSRDFEGYINEIFKTPVVGSDLKNSLLIMFNKLRKEKLIPRFFNYANIVPKKGSKLLLKNERGIFRVSVIRSILMLLIYERKNADIDSQMSECQTGGRKGRGCKNNIFILNGIIHDVLSQKKKKPVCFQFYDYAQMFDSINLQETISDIRRWIR